MIIHHIWCIKEGDYMPFTTVKTEELIENKKQKDAEFAKQWDESRNEYKLIQEMIRIRKEQHITQTQLAQMTGNKQQSISRIEKKLVKPSLASFCKIINALGYDLKIVKK